jgi:hypothetical protein
MNKASKNPARRYVNKAAAGEQDFTIDSSTVASSKVFRTSTWVKAI